MKNINAIGTDRPKNTDAAFNEEADAPGYCVECLSSLTSSSSAEEPGLCAEAIPWLEGAKYWLMQGWHYLVAFGHYLLSFFMEEAAAPPAEEVEEPEPVALPAEVIKPEDAAGVRAFYEKWRVKTIPAVGHADYAGVCSEWQADIWKMPAGLVMELRSFYAQTVDAHVAPGAKEVRLGELGLELQVIKGGEQRYGTADAKRGTLEAEVGGHPKDPVVLAWLHDWLLRQPGIKKDEIAALERSQSRDESKARAFYDKWHNRVIPATYAYEYSGVNQEWVEGLFALPESVKENFSLMQMQSPPGAKEILELLAKWLSEHAE